MPPSAGKLPSYSSDLVGSTTALSTRMDPEDLREVISAYQQCVPCRDRAPLRRLRSGIAWATACWFISAIRRPMRTTPSGPSGRGSRLIASVSGPQGGALRCKPGSG